MWADPMELVAGRSRGPMFLKLVTAPPPHLDVLASGLGYPTGLTQTEERERR